MWLRRRGITHYEFAEKIGVTKSTVSRWFNGKHKINLRTAERVEEFTNKEITIEDLFESDGD